MVAAPSWSGMMQVGRVVETRLKCFVYFRVGNRQGYHVATLRHLDKTRLRRLTVAVNDYNIVKQGQQYSTFCFYSMSF